MAHGIAGFIDYGPDGKPFMGLLITEGAVEVKIYLAHGPNAYPVVGELTRQLKMMAADLIKMPDKLVVAGSTDGKIKGLQVLSRRKPVPHPAGSPVLGAGGAGSQGPPAPRLAPVRPGKGTRPENNLLQRSRQAILGGMLYP